jgi:hypothetical protein
MNPVFALSSYFFMNNFYIILFYTPCDLFPSASPAKMLDVFLIFPMRAACLAHLIPLYVITLIILHKGYKFSHEAPDHAILSSFPQLPLS